MSQLFVNLPCPAGNGSGAAVDVSSFGGPLKSVAYSGRADCIVTIEMSNDPAAINWAPVTVFQGGGVQDIYLAARWMRATVQSYKSGTPQVDIGGTSEGTTFAQLVAPAGDGGGAAVDVSALGIFKTIHVGGTFAGNVNVEVSEDGTTNWATVASFRNPGQISLNIAAHHMRVRRNGTTFVASPGLPVIYVASTNPVSGSGGVAIAAGTQVAGAGTVTFANSNGVTFGMSNSNQVTAQFDAIKTMSANGVTASGPTFQFSNLNGVTFGIVGNVLTASVQTAGGTATGVGISAGTQLATTGAVVFANSNGISFGLSAQTLTASIAPALALSAGSQSVATGTMAFVNSNGVSFGMSGSSQITASAYQPTVLRAVGFTATGGETQFTVTFTPAAANTAYSVWPGNNGVSQLFVYDCPAGSASRSVSAFGVVPSASLSAGDQVAFLLFES